MRERNWPKAQAQLANAGQVDSSAFIYDLAGGDGSLRTYSTLRLLKSACSTKTLTTHWSA